MIDLVYLYFIFFKIGLFTIGGGLAAIPLIQEEVIARGWLSAIDFANMIAISESTPGPIGVNVATFVGFSQYGAIGSVIATLGIVSPSILIIMVISHYLRKFKDNKYVKGMFVGLRPAVVGIILVAAYFIAKVALVNIDLYETSNILVDLFNIKAIVMFFVFLYASNKWNHHPITYLALSGIIGILIF